MSLLTCCKWISGLFFCCCFRKRMKMADDKPSHTLCESCEKKEVESVATVFCFECDETKCEICKNKHSRNRATRRHNLIQIHGAPRDITHSFLKAFRRCPKHPNEEVVFSCGFPSVLCCSACAKEFQARGEDVTSLVDAAHIDKQSSKDTETIEQYDKLAIETADVFEQRRKQRDAIDNAKESFKTKLNVLKETVNELFDNFAKRVTNDVEETHEEMLDNIKKPEKELTNKEYMSRKLKEFTVLALDSKDNVKVYLANTELKKHVQDLEKLIGETRTDKLEDLSVPDISSIESKIKKLFESGENERTEHEMDKAGPKASERKTVSGWEKPDLMQSYAIKDHESFTDCAWLNDEHIVLIDPSGKRLFSYLVYQNSLKELLAFPSLPWHVEPVDTDTVVVTFHAERKIRFVRVVPGEATILREIYIFEMCFGIHYEESEKTLYILLKLIAIGTKGAEIRKFSLEGEQLGTLELDDDATMKLAASNAFTISKDRKTLILACNTHEVVFIDINGGRIRLIYDPDLLNPVFVTTDNESNVYVVWSTNSLIHMLNANGEYIRNILTGSDGVALPARLYFNQSSDKFILVDQFRKKQIKLYNYI